MYSMKAVWAHGYWDIGRDIIEVLISRGLAKPLQLHACTFITCDIALYIYIGSFSAYKLCS